MYDVVSFGEILIDFTFAGKSSDGKNLYEENTGGAPANCVSAVAKLGGKSAFLGMTGRDSFGSDVRKSLEEIGVDTNGMRYSENHHTTLAFVSLDENGERRFSFCRNPGADTQFDYSDVDEQYLTETKVFHIGSLSLTAEPSKTTTLKMIQKAKSSGAIISYDPNWRESLWKGIPNALDELKSLMNYADIVKISDEEMNLLYDGTIDLESAAEKIHLCGVKLVLITLGSKGVFYSFKNNEKNFCGTVRVPHVKVVDTTGAGDSFTGGILFSLTRASNIFDFTQTELEKHLYFSNCVASLCVSARGAIPALPTMKEVEDFIKNN